MRLSIRNLSHAYGGTAGESELQVEGGGAGKTIVLPGEEMEFEIGVGEGNGLKVNEVLTEAGKEVQKERLKKEKEVREQREVEAGAQPKGKKKGEDEDPLSSPGPKAEAPKTSGTPPLDSRDVKGEAPLKR